MNTTKELLIDMMPFQFVKDNLFEETSKDPNKKLMVRGILQRANVKNQNGRIYPKEVLVREAKKYEENFIRNRMATGELDHPESAVINLKNVSHNIVEVHWDGDNLIGTLEVLPTPNGNILRELFKANIRVGISSRGLGTVKKGMNEDSGDFVQDDFDLLSFDVVSSPSTVGAFLFPVGNLNEGIIKNPITNKWIACEDIIRDILSEIK